ncbi:hypothetical protein F5883DRAFT_242934 [Diaporthe sp. PMI_573]|nr:hypothetical protein F5883DRAFT_242934 [Diaporthaceae sp. PMI_573]
MSPIRTALIGLSSSGGSWAAAAHLPYLLSQRGREKFEIVALCNSSEDAARAAIANHSLPASIKAYGNPETLAADPDIDLVVCCTRVDLHHATTLASVKAGKAAYVEWPLAHNVQHARELSDAARQSGSRTVVGNQGRIAPIVLKAKEVLQQGRIGKVLRSDFEAVGGPFDGDVLPIYYKFLVQKAIGGNAMTISFSHLWDQVQSVLGEAINVRSNVEINHPLIRVIDPGRMTLVETVKADVPDLITTISLLTPSDSVADGAELHGRFRRGQPHDGETPLVWTITGEKGELKLVSNGSFALHATAYSRPVTLEARDFTTNKVERINWSWSEWQERLPMASRNVGALYEAFADQLQLPIQTFDSATRRLKQVHKMIEGTGPSEK